MLTTYVLDTNVLLSDPKALFHFEEHDVVIPVKCIEELDKFKRERLTARGSAARTVSRYLDKLRERGSLKNGVTLNGGGTLRIDFGEGATLGAVDDHTVKLAHRLSAAAGEDRRVVLVSRDTNMRIKADVQGVAVEDYRHDEAPFELSSDGYQGFDELTVSSEVIDALYGEGLAEIEATFYPNQFIVAVDAQGRSALTRYLDGRLGLIPKRMEAWGLKPRSKEQSFALSALLDPTIPLVTLAGKAGTGKTLVALAAGLSQSAEVGVGNLYRRVLVARPMISMGKEVGYLPGDLEDKMKPWMQPIFDNLEVLVGADDKMPKYQFLLDSGKIKVEALSFIRGRSIPTQFLIIDEAQNLTPHEAKTILTRAGEGTKIVMTGDPAQIDNPYVDSKSNGLTYVIEAFKNSDLAAHMTFTKGERSPLADEAAKLL